MDSTQNTSQTVVMMISIIVLAFTVFTAPVAQRFRVQIPTGIREGPRRRRKRRSR